MSGHNDAAMALFYLYGVTRVLGVYDNVVHEQPAHRYMVEIDLEAALDALPPEYVGGFQTNLWRTREAGAIETDLDGRSGSRQDGLVHHIDYVQGLEATMGGGSMTTSIDMFDWGAPSTSTSRNRCSSRRWRMSRSSRRSPGRDRRAPSNCLRCAGRATTGKRRKRPFWRPATGTGRSGRGTSASRATEWGTPQSGRRRAPLLVAGRWSSNPLMHRVPAIVGLLLLTACASPTFPSESPASVAPSDAPANSASISASASVEASAEPAAPIVVDELAQVVIEGLSVRTEPSVGAERLGTPPPDQRRLSFSRVPSRLTDTPGTSWVA